jgi:hypothetical protein
MALSNPTHGVLTAPSASTLTIYNQNGSYIVPASVAIPATSPIGTNNLPNGILQSNQVAYLDFGFRAAGGLNVSDLTATLLPSANLVTNAGWDVQDYGPMTVDGHSVFKEFALTAIGTNSQTISANFQLQVTAVGKSPILETNSFALTIGSWTTTWSNTNAIVITGESVEGDPVIAAPYPSIITVTNVGGVLVGVTTTLTNYSDQSPQAVQVLLVSPSLEDTLLMAGAGPKQFSATGVTLTFSNCVPANPVPSTTLTNGVYSPTQTGGITPFP